MNVLSNSYSGEIIMGILILTCDIYKNRLIDLNMSIALLELWSMENKLTEIHIGVIWVQRNNLNTMF